MFGNAPSVDKTKRMWHDRNQSSFSFVEENSMHKLETDAMKRQEIADNKIRNEYENQLVEIYDEKMKLLDKENIHKKTEYRQYLLKQIDDNKEKQKQSDTNVLESKPAPFSEEILNAIERNNLKLSKQKEIRSGLDECIKWKNDAMMKNLQRDSKEEQKRTEFLIKRDNDHLLDQKKAKQMTKQKDDSKNEVAMLWQTQNDTREIKREKFIDTLLEKERITDLDHLLRQESLLESLKQINSKEELCEQVDEKVHLNMNDLDQSKSQTNFETIEQGKHVECDASFPNSVSKTDEVDSGMLMNSVLKQQNRDCPNNKFFGLSD